MRQNCAFLNRHRPGSAVQTVADCGTFGFGWLRCEKQVERVGVSRWTNLNPW